MNARPVFPRLAAATLAAALATPALAQSRGELLYTTHCISCHTTEMHWREKRAATDWTSLKYQVRRWQAAASLDWPERDIVAVSRHLNETIYRFEQTTDRVSLAPRARPVNDPTATQGR